MGLVDIINSFPDSATHEKVAAAVKGYAEGKSADEIFNELSFRMSESKRKLSLKIQSYSLELLLFQLATGITTQEETTMCGLVGKKGYRSFTCLVGLLSGRTNNVTETGIYLKRLFTKHQNSFIDKGGNYVLGNDIINILLSIPPDATFQEAVQTIEGYAKNKTSSQILNELQLLKAKIRQEVLRRIHQHNLQYPLFKLATGITAQENITIAGKDEVVGYRSLEYLATLLSGRVIKNVAKVGEYFRKLAQEHNMPLLTQKHQDYIDGFTLEYVQLATIEQLQQEIHLGTSFSLDSEVKTYSPFLHELSKKIVQNHELQFELFKKWTGITAQEQIVEDSKEKERGYKIWVALATLLNGRRMGSNTKVGEYFRKLAQEHNMPLLTQKHQDYIDGFTLEYVQLATRDQLQREIIVNFSFSLDPKKHIYSIFLHHLSQKIVKNPELQFELFKKWTGITSKEEVTSAKEVGYNSNKGLITVLAGKTMKVIETKGFIKKLLDDNDVPLWTKEHQDLLDNLSVGYIKDIAKDQLRGKIPIKSGFSINPEHSNYLPFLYEVSRRVSQDSELQFELFKKWTGIKAQEQIVSYDKEAIPGCESLRGLAALLTGKKHNSTQARSYFLSLFGEHSQKDEEYYKLRNTLIELRRNNNGNGAIKPIGKNPFSGFGKCFEYYVGILLALENNAVEHQYKIETKDSFRLVDFYMGNKGYISVEELGELVEVKSGVNITPHDKAQLKDFLAQQNGVAYIVYDAESPLIKALKQIADEEGKDITILPYTKLGSITAINGADISMLFSDKEQFKECIRTKDKNQLEADLFSAYLWVRETGGKEGLISVLNAAYNQNQEEKDSVRDAHNINWLSINEYQRQALEVFSKEKGRHFDLELAKKKLWSKILALKRDIVVNNEEYEQEIRLIEKTDGKYDLQEFYIRDKLLGTALWLKNGDVEAIF